MGMMNILTALILCLSAIANVNAKTIMKSDSDKLVIALMHYAPTTGDMRQNTERVKRAMTAAKGQGANWFVTPELSLTGYYFNELVGTEWLRDKVDPYKANILQHAKHLKLVSFLSHIEYSDDSFYNTLFVVNEQGSIVAKHRKINTIPGSEAWSTPGKEPVIATVGAYKVGLLICADAWPETHAGKLKHQGADIVISPANWGPGQYGPGNTWIKRSKELGVPLVVNNRTGIDKTLDMRKAISVVAENGQHLFEFESEEGALILLEFARNMHGIKFLNVQNVIKWNSARFVMDGLEVSKE